MGRFMARSSIRRVAISALLAIALGSINARAGIPERLKWLRGTVVSATCGSITMQLRSKTALIAVDDATDVMIVGANGVTRAARSVDLSTYLKAGDPVEVHYQDSRPAGMARYIWVGLPLDANSISKRPGTSAAGSVSDLRSGNWFVAARMTLTSGKDHRTFRLPRAADALQPNDRVVVMYRQYKSTLTAKVIRTIPHSGVPVAAGF